jgi:hypothetical protein
MKIAAQTGAARRMIACLTKLSFDVLACLKLGKCCDAIIKASLHTLIKIRSKSDENQGFERVLHDGPSRGIGTLMFREC